MDRPSFANHQPFRHAIAVFALGIGLSICIAWLDLTGFAPMVRLDRAVMDGLATRFASGYVASRTVVVDIDDVSLSAVGQWPWPRYRMAALVRRVADAKPAAIGLDILFPEADRTSLVSIQQSFKRDFDVDVSFAGVPKGLLDNDGYFGHEIARAGVVAANYFYFDHADIGGEPLRTGFSFAGGSVPMAVNVASGVLRNAAGIASQTRFSGFVNSHADDDGTLRRMPLLIQHRGVLHPSLALATTLRSMGVTSGAVESHADGLSLQFGSHRVPIDAQGNALLLFDGKPSLHASVSAVDVLNGSVPASAFEGKVVFIGTTAVGLNDFHSTALDPRFPGLKIQSVMAEQLLSDRYIRLPTWGSRARFAACAVVGSVLAALFVAGVGIASIGGAAVLVAAGFAASSVALYTQAALFISPAAPLVTAAVLSVLAFAARFVGERRRASRWLKQLENARQVTIESMASVAETRDPETGAHIKRTQNYVRAIAEELRRAGYRAETLSGDFIRLLFISAPLHDIGKVGVPDHILLKPGRLTVAEMEVMKQHAEFGRRIIFSSAERIDGDNFLVVAGEIAATHHEKWDGTGYPLGLAGEDIPLSGRIMAVADIYDALISRRCYKEPFTHEHATALMRDMRGTTFDPVILDAFFAIERKIIDIATLFKDDAQADHGAKRLGALPEARPTTPPEVAVVQVERPRQGSRRASTLPSFAESEVD